VACPVSPTKTRYGSETSARIALSMCQIRNRKERGYYRCKGCKGWHLTSKGEK
jgi:hypothetical protein